MGYTCQTCNKHQQSRPNRIIATREKIYPPRKDDRDKVIDKGGKGWETVRMKFVCTKCALLQKNEPTEELVEVIDDT